MQDAAVCLYVYNGHVERRMLDMCAMLTTRSTHTHTHHSRHLFPPHLPRNHGLLVADLHCKGLVRVNRRQGQEVT